jgi:DNA modification methylase
MKYYYEDKWVKIIHGDCREILPQLDVKVDLVLTDPPYLAKNIGVHEKVYSTESAMPTDPIAYDQFCQEWFNLANKICDRIVLTPGTRSIWRYPAAKWVLCWHKPGAVNYSAFGGFNIWEPILCYGDFGKGRHFVEDYISSVNLNLSKGIESNHPCPKNPSVWDWLVINSSNVNDLILDPFLGSGTTCYCAKKLNRYSIGIEIEEKYCEIAAKRCMQESFEFDKIDTNNIASKQQSMI